MTTVGIVSIPRSGWSNLNRHRGRERNPRTPFTTVKIEVLGRPQERKEEESSGNGEWTTVV